MAKKKKGFLESAKDTLKEGAMQVADDIHYMMGTERGEKIEKSLDEKYPYRKKGYSEGGMAVKGCGMAKPRKFKLR
jgi:hypothetical protein